ncbi:MAG TPA: AIPR family protein [Nostocaceae cyanobacterium]|nr:AIPR family protein [Nostocaceae cyanobacterium]
MSANDILILEQILTEKKQIVSPNMAEPDFFEVFVADQLLKNYDLSHEEIESGIMGKGDDGGIDAMYTFVNGQLIVEDTDLTHYKKDISIELFIIQLKTSKTFTEETIQKLEDTTLDILNISKNLSEFILYNQELLQIAGYFQKAYRGLVAKFPRLTISYFYATKGDTTEIHPKVKERVNKLENAVKSLFPKVEFNFKFEGARELIKLADNNPSNSLQMRLLENPITTTGGYSCLVLLYEYYKFITENKDILRKYIFDSNVRDYEGDVEVNQDIRKSLANKTSEDFWWLNNGITIIADKGQYSNKILTLENVQIVNGLQTSMEIYTYFKNNKSELDERSVLVKVITTEDTASRDKIIKATNRQTAIPPASLRATDEIQRDIEKFFLSHDLYYDRRKNFYKNQGKPKDNIISITYLAQAVMSIVFREPDVARSRPSSLLKTQSVYEKIFSKSYPIGVYLTSVLLMKKIDIFIKNLSGISSDERNNLKFYTAMYVAIDKIGKSNYTVEEVEKLDVKSIDQVHLSQSIENVRQIFNELRETTQKSADVIAKSKDFVEEILKYVANFTPGSISL